MIQKIVESMRQSTFPIDSQVSFPDILGRQGKVKGNLCEQSVRNSLQNYGFQPLNDFSQDKDYSWKRSSGVRVYDNFGRAIHEYDDIGHLISEPVSIEVKAGRIRGFKKKLDRSIEIASRVFEKPPVQLLFLPYDYLKPFDLDYIAELEDKGIMYAINTGWTQAALDIEVNEYYEFQGMLCDND